MGEKIKVVLLQAPDGQVRRVRVGGAEFDVLHAGPVLVAGGMGVAISIGDAEISVEPAPLPAASAG